MRYRCYADFDADYKFAEKAGFQLTPGQIALIDEAIAWPKNLNKAEVGCGKTVISTVLSLMHDYDVTIVTVPPILVDGWVLWLNKVSGNVVDFSGDPRERRDLSAASKTARWIVCSHAIYRSDYNSLLAYISRRAFEVIEDEAHWSKNSRSVLFRKIKNMTKGDRGLQMLTGTPVSKPLDSYSYIKLKTPEIYRDRSHFEAVHVKSRDFFKNPKTYCNLDELKKNLDIHTIDATKEKLLGYKLKVQTPDCTYSLAPAHYKLYAKLVDEQLLTFDDGSIIDVSTVQKLRQALQQVVVNWDHFGDDPTLKSEAYTLIDQTVEEIEVDRLDKSKLIIWTKYKRSSRRVAEYCNGLGIPTVAAYSEVDSKKSVAAFMDDEKTRILVAQPQSCGAGLNAQYVCSEALFVEMDTVPIYARQAFGRIDRFGQTRTPRIKVGVAKGTVQVDLLKSLLNNDDTVTRIEPSKRSIREMLLGH